MRTGAGTGAGTGTGAGVGVIIRTGAKSEILSFEWGRT